MDTNSDFKSDLDSLTPKLSAALREDRKQIEILTKRIAKNEALLRAIRNAMGMDDKTNGQGYGSKRQVIRDAIGRIPKATFTQDDVETQIAQLDPTAEINRARIRATLWTLSSKGKVIRTVKSGTNRTPAEFQRVDNAIQQKRKPELVKNGV